MTKTSPFRPAASSGVSEICPVHSAGHPRPVYTLPPTPYSLFPRPSLTPHPLPPKNRKLILKIFAIRSNRINRLYQFVT